jgi:hypothetical protein
MILRARHLFVSWLAYGVLQLVLLGVGGVAGAQLGIGARSARAQCESQHAPLGKRLLASEAPDRRVLPTPFAPSACFRLDVSAPLDRQRSVDEPARVDAADRLVLPPVRAPPALS